MKKSLFSKIPILFFVLLVACNSSGRKNNQLFSVDVTGAYPERDIDLSKIADIEYIQFKTPDSITISTSTTRDMAMSDENIVLRDIESGTIYIFDNSGNYISSFNRKGRSGEEYMQLAASAVDFENREIVIDNNYMGMNKGSDKADLLVYSFEGEFKRKFNLSDSILINMKGLFNYDQEHYLIYNDKDLDMNHPILGNSEDASESPYLLISKESGAVTPLDIKVKDRYGNKIVKISEPSKGQFAINMELLDASPLFSVGNDLIISDFALDTVYNYRDKKLTPLFVWDKSRVGAGDKYLNSIFVETESYTFLKTIKKPTDSGSDAESKEYNFMFIDKDDNQVYKLGDLFMPEIDDFSFYPISSKVMEGTIYTSFDAYQLIDMNEEGRLSGELQEIANNLDEEGNPVIMVIKFK